MLGAFIRRLKIALGTITGRSSSGQTEGSQDLNLDPCFVDEYQGMTIGSDAARRLRAKSDFPFFHDGDGITEVDRARWEEAQRYERRVWMEGGGLALAEDRNTVHERCFDGYASLQGRHFEHVIEIGCGPFTNVVRILKVTRCRRVTLLDPLIDDYLAHPHCPYGRDRLKGFEGKVRTVSLPIESFDPGETYDLVVVINVLEHCFSTTRFFERLITLTSPEGILVFHDKLIPARIIGQFAANIYDAGHPLRVAGERITNFLHEYYTPLYERTVDVPSPIGSFNSIYFIGQRGSSKPSAKNEVGS